MKRALAKLSLVLVSLLFLAGLGETLARAHYLHKYHVGFTRTLPLTHQHEFGWEGRRIFGDPASPKVKLLVVGDSMTYGLGVADADLYPTVLGRALNAEVFTYGGSGYGTLQEYLVVAKYLDTVRPDAVLLQTSFNDFINNSWEMERASHLNNNLATRPYLEGGQVVYRFPSRFGDYGPFVAHSRLMYSLAIDGARVGAVLAMKGWLHTVESDMAQGAGFPPFRRSLETTSTIIGMLKARARLLAFAADGPEPYWSEIFKQHNVPFFSGVPVAIAAEEGRLGVSIRPDGAHWDARGHEVVGHALARWLSQFLSH